MFEPPPSEADFRLLYDRYLSTVVHLVRRLGAAESEDVVQETFLSAWRSLPTLRERKKLASWLSRIATRKSSAHHRRATRQQLDGSDWEEVTLVDSQPPPALVLDVRRALSALPRDVRLALLLSRLEGYELADVANELGVSISTAKRRIAEGEATLRTLLA